MGRNNNTVRNQIHDTEFMDEGIDDVHNVLFELEFALGCQDWNAVRRAHKFAEMSLSRLNFYKDRTTRVKTTKVQEYLAEPEDDVD